MVEGDIKDGTATVRPMMEGPHEVDLILRNKNRRRSSYVRDITPRKVQVQKGSSPVEIEVPEAAFKKAIERLRR